MSMNVKTIDFDQGDVGLEFVRSLHETGFAVLRNHPIPRQLLDAMYQGWRDFFNSDEKHDYLFDPDNYDGKNGLGDIEITQSLTNPTDGKGRDRFKNMIVK